MEFSYEQIMEDRQYPVICEYFLELVHDSESKRMLEDILYNGCFNSHSIACSLPCRDNPSIERQRRIAMAYLLVNDLDTFKYLAQNNIDLFHGTNANALPGVLKYGLSSNSALQEKKVDIKTGEYNSLTGNRSFISFTDLLDLARDYSTLPAKNGEEKLDFQVVLGTTSSKVRSARTCSVSSDLSEVGVVDSFPIEKINCLLVPQDKVKFVKKMTRGMNIDVLGISREEDKFYYIDPSTGFIELDDDRYEEFKNGMRKSNFKFSLSDLEEVVKSVSARKMWEFLSGKKKDMSAQIGGDIDDGRKR